MTKGIGVSAGIGIGRVQRIVENELKWENRPISDTQAEKERLDSAIDRFCQDTNELADRTEQRIGKGEADIIRGHVFMITDPYMKSEMVKLIEGGQCAESALQTMCDMFAQMFGASDDELLQQRATDVNDIKSSILKILLGIEDVRIDALPENTVLVVSDLTPSMTVSINRHNVAGILTETGGTTSHSAILSRALQIPAVLSIPNITQTLENGDMVILDGGTGEVFVNPDPKTVEEYTEKRDAFLHECEMLKAYIGRPTVTRDGRSVELVCNIGSADEAKSVIDNDGEGVGLFRTEFLFMDTPRVPGEEEQFEAYKKAALTVKGKPLIVRTLDVGGDKDIPYLGMKKEENPFLGFRAIRYCLKNRELFRSQLRALLRAGAYGDVRIMLPMVSCVEELMCVREMMEELKAELEQEGIPYGKDTKLGVMIETPAAMLIADILARHADFFSIGTNDLTQYIMAVDRGNSDVSYLYSTLNPAVLRAINSVIQAGHRGGIPVGMCGEAAGDERMIPLLLAMGLDEFSVSPASVLKTRERICRQSVKELEPVVEKVLSASCVKEVKKITDSLL